ncbi:MAG: DUF4129 domain-containing protein [Armatimonadetes bacterium]|nr:DUF4129 domain-containing protein [Armatimonadota bacterium]
MRRSRSSLQDGAESLARFWAPALSAVAVGALLLYPCAGLAMAGQADALLCWAASMVISGIGMAMTLAEASRLSRGVASWALTVIGPGALLFVATSGGSRSMMSLAAGLMLLSSTGWWLMVALLEEYAGLEEPDDAAKPRTVRTFTLLPPFFVERPVTGRGSSAFSGNAIASVGILGAVILAGGESLASTGAPVAPAWPFGLVLYGSLGMLASLSKLQEQVRSIGRGVQVAGSIVPAWLQSALIVLAASALLGLLLPKQIPTGPGQAAKASAWERLTNAAPQPDPSSQGEEGRGQPWNPGFEGLNRGARGAGGQGQGLAGTLPGQVRPEGAPGGKLPRPVPGKPGEQGPRQPSVAEQALAKALDAATAIARLGEGGAADGSQGGQGRSPGGSERGEAQGPSGAQRSGADGEGEGEGQGQGRSAADGQAQAQTPAEKASRLAEALRENPLRLLKLALFMAVVTFALYAWRKWAWPVVLRCLAWLGSRAAAAWAAARRGVLGSLDRRRREARFQAALAAAGDPFADPLAEQVSPDRFPEAAYAGFTAQVWLMGREKGDAETAFDFAASLARSSSLDASAVQTITRECVGAHFSGSSLDASAVERVRQALRVVRDQVEGSMAPDLLAQRKAQYRRQLAEAAMTEP